MILIYLDGQPTRARLFLRKPILHGESHFYLDETRVRFAGAGRVADARKVRGVDAVYFKSDDGTT